MKKILSAALSVLLIASVFSGCSKNDGYQFEERSANSDVIIKAVTFNCAAPWGNALKGTGSSARVKRFASYMNTVRPDIIGTQEMNSKWMDRLEELLPDYDSYGVKRGGDDSESKSEMNCVFWRSDLYECVDKNTFWLSRTPDEESRYEGAGCNRVCTYVILKNKNTQKTILHMNTHLDNASEEARGFGAQVIMDKLDEIKENSGQEISGVILTGDFNDTYDSEPYEIITQKLADTYSKDTGGFFGKKSTYHDWGKLTNDRKPIDFIFSNLSCTYYQVLDDTTGGYVSDHYGVYSELVLL